MDYANSWRRVIRRTFEKPRDIAGHIALGRQMQLTLTSTINQNETTLLRFHYIGLGQHFMGKSRQAEHQALIDWLLTIVEEHAVDAVLIAGDLFDTGTPPSYARELYNQLVLRLDQSGVGLLLLGGNHDSVAVLGESRALLARLGAVVVPGADDPESQLQLLTHRDGSVTAGVELVGQLSSGP